MTDGTYGKPVSADDPDALPPGDLVPVPDVINLDGTHALNLLQGAGFTVESQTVPSAETGANIVLEQQPPAETLVVLPAAVLVSIGSGVPSEASPRPTGPDVVLDS